MAVTFGLDNYVSKYLGIVKQCSSGTTNSLFASQLQSGTSAQTSSQLSQQLNNVGIAINLNSKITQNIDTKIAQAAGDEELIQKYETEKAQLQAELESLNAKKEELSTQYNSLSTQSTSSLYNTGLTGLYNTNSLYTNNLNTQTAAQSQSQVMQLLAGLFGMTNTSNTSGTSVSTATTDTTSTSTTTNTSQSNPFLQLFQQFIGLFASNYA